MPDDHFHDTTYFCHYAGMSENEAINKVLPGQTNDQSLKNRDCLEDVIDNYQEKTIMVYVFDADSIETLSWSDICHRYLVLKRYELNLNQLNSMNWEINYP
ncbi:MAG: hypothetical protein CVU05_10475 [Bacteroidetes bacterium HGW-Bacteroidetes-21]|jgi:hypothetical protein|nr:MAG: hypothetical protein CVU05_10475 [Bacteroidetes bacterium HGW-Bacteroidetes-21]